MWLYHMLFNYSPGVRYSDSFKCLLSEMALWWPFLPPNLWLLLRSESPWLGMNSFSSSFFKRFYLFIFTEVKRRGMRGRETSTCGCLSHAPHWGPGPQSRYVPWLGIELVVTLWFTVRCSIHWATPAREVFKVLKTALAGATQCFPLSPFPSFWK